MGLCQQICTMPTLSPQDAWIYDITHHVYFQRSSDTYAIPNASTGQWTYLSASEFRPGESSLTAQARKGAEADWGLFYAADSRANGHRVAEGAQSGNGVMEDGELDEAPRRHNGIPASETPSAGRNLEKHPSYRSDPSYNESKHSAYTKTVQEPEPPDPTPSASLLRLVVVKSTVLTPGQVAIIDAREGGIQIGRDRIESGGQVRLRVKEMEVSKTHAVLYWGKGEDEEYAWWIVDLGRW